MNVNIEGINKASLVKALYDNAKPVGLGYLQYKNQNMSLDEAQKEYDNHKGNFDYLYGRVMKIDISGNVTNGRLYDRDNGEGKVKEIVESLRK